MSFGELIDMTLSGMEETRFKKKNGDRIQKLTKTTHFNFAELETILLIYYKVQKHGGEKSPGMYKFQFRDVLHCALDMTDDGLMDRIFLALDPTPTPLITMETWAHSLSLFLRGTLEEKIDYCFTVYNLMGDGLLGRETMFQLLRSSLVSQGGEEEAEEGVKDMTEIVTKKMDLDHDGKISYNDYKTSVLQEPKLLQVFGLCLPPRAAVNTFVTTYAKRPSKM